MLPYSSSQLANLRNAIAYAESRRMFWWQSTGSHEYFVASMRTSLDYGRESARRRAFDLIASSDAYWDNMIQDLVSY